MFCMGFYGVTQYITDMLLLQETKLEYNCECGCNTSVRRSTFLTLPRYLIIHLKRFRFSPSLEVEKLHDPVVLQPFRELMVTTSQADGWYKLISVISHLGYNWNSGHYSECVNLG
ncbi:ubiquitin carboxyl-terminal hydrolase 7-like [Perca flavescens]|uniref:ubiquitin carboxyl-terminal hydrolase 7-like n=1 Tax=Perca flavescens TaxID=8167 RepID=UPI00106E48FF|nr:ubiquitin carboxyl-terminal hydrolase 7-like [Perca flavescens]